MKWKPPEWLMRPPSSRVIFWLNVLTALALAALAILAYPSWIALLDAVLAGQSIGVLVHLRYARTMRQLSEAQRAHIAALEDFNRALVESRVRLHIAQIGIDHDDSPPISPKLH